jgi:hypothetical protein
MFPLLGYTVAYFLALFYRIAKEFKRLFLEGVDPPLGTFSGTAFYGEVARRTEFDWRTVEKNVRSEA